MTRPAVNRQDTLNLLYAETCLLNRPGFGQQVANIYLDCAIGITRYKSLSYIIQIANMAGFLLWLSITSIMIKVFKVALAQWLSYYQ